MSGFVLSGICISDEASEGTADGGRTKARPAKGPLADTFDSVRWCNKRGAGITGILLLVGKTGRSGCIGATTFAWVSDLFKPPNLDGGAGREPVGRASLVWRRLSR